MNRAASPSIRVLHLLPALGRDGQIGGAERMAVELVKWFQAPSGKDWDVQLCILGSRDPHWASYGLTSEPWTLGCDGTAGSLALLGHARTVLHRVLQEFRPHIVHSHLWPADQAAACAVLPTKTRHVAHVHDAWSIALTPGLRGLLRRTLYAVLLRRSRATFIACAEAVKTTMVKQLRLSSTRVHVIHNGVSSSWFSPEPVAARQRTPIIIGCAGRLQPMKGHELLLRAIRELTNRSLRARLLIAGGGSSLDAHRQLAAELGLADRVEFLGRVREMKAFYDQLDIYALPSFTEGLPISMLEAMSRSLPVVATRVGGIPEVVRDGEDGILVAPGDEKALTEALASLVSDVALRERMGHSAWQRAKHCFSFERMANSVEQFYRALLS